jgi:hypothetical protein
MGGCMRYTRDVRVWWGYVYVAYEDTLVYVCYSVDRIQDRKYSSTDTVARPEPTKHLTLLIESQEYHLVLVKV